MENLWSFITIFAILTLTFIKRKKQLGKTWEKPVAAKIAIKGKELKCSHCGGHTFSKREALLNTSFVTLFRFNFLNRSGSAFVCQNCQMIHWFLQPVEKDKIKLKKTKEEV